jgi:hypothetical protein
MRSAMLPNIAGRCKPHRTPWDSLSVRTSRFRLRRDSRVNGCRILRRPPRNEALHAPALPGPDSA